MPWFVCTISIRAFKSFGAETVTLNLRSGLLAIVGPNGAGKSNVLDALCFAAGCPPSVLRVKTLRELVAQNLPIDLCFVEFGIAQAQSSSLGSRHAKGTTAMQHSVRAALTPAGCREYKIDGKIKTGQQVAAFLHTCGVYLDFQTSIIRQAQVTRLADNNSPEGIAEFIANSSGLSRWMLEAARASEELVTTRGALVYIHSSICTLQGALKEDEENQQQISRAQALDRQIDGAAVELAARLRRLIHALREVSEEQHVRKLKLEAEVQQLAAEEEQAGAALGEASEEREQQLARQRCAKGRQSTALSRQQANQQEQVRVLEQQLRSIKEREEQAMQLADSREQLQQIVNQLSSRIERLQDLQEVLEEMQQGSYAVGIRQLRSHAEAARCQSLELQELLLAEEQACARAEAELGAVAASLQACRSSRAQSEGRLPPHPAMLPYPLLPKLAPAAAAARGRPGTEAQREAAAQGGGQDTGSATALRQQLEEAEMRLNSCRRRKQELQHRLTAGSQQPGPPGAAGASTSPPSSTSELHQCFTFKHPLEGAHSGGATAQGPTHGLIRALAAIGGSHLRVLVCGTNAEAARILEHADSMRTSSAGRQSKLRIWPLDSISAPDNSSRQRSAVRALGPGRAWLAQDLVEAALPAYSTALRRAFGHMIIVRDEQCASQVSVQHGLACVTLDGLVSKPGSISGGGQGRGPNEALLLDKLAFETAVAEERQHAAEVAKLEGLLVAAVEFEEGQARLAELQSEEQALMAKAQELEEAARSLAKSVQQLRVELETADKEASRSEALLSAALEQTIEPHCAMPPLLPSAARSRPGPGPPQAPGAALDHQGGLESSAADGGGSQLRQGMSSSRAELEEARSSHQEAVTQLEEVESKLEEVLLLLGHDHTSVSSITWSKAIFQQPGSAGAAKAAELQAAVAQLQALNEQLDKERAMEDDQQRHAQDVEQQIKEMTKLMKQVKGKQHKARAEADALGAKIQEDKGKQGNAEAALQDLVSSFPHLPMEVGKLQLQLLSEEAACGASSSDARRARVDALAQDASLASAQLGRLKASRSKVQISPVAIAEELLRQERALTLRQLSDHYSSLEEAVQSLDKGLQEARKQVLHANEVVFTEVSKAFQKLCSMVLPSMVIRLAKTGDCASKGLVVSITRNAAWDVAGGGPGPSGARPASGSGSLEQLSGGQRTLVSLALLLAAAESGTHSSTLLLDEVDAALDEHNQLTIVRLLRDLSQLGGVQLICVSHNKIFHQACDALLHLSRDAAGSSVCDPDQGTAAQHVGPAAQPQGKKGKPKQRQRR